MTSHVVSLSHTTHPLVRWNCRLYLVTFLISKNLSFLIHLQISVQLFAVLSSRKYHVPCCLVVQDSSDITSNCIHLVAVNGEFTETLDMVSILKSDDIQPPPTPITFPSLELQAVMYWKVYLFVNRHAENSVHNYDRSRTAKYMHCQNFVALIKTGHNTTFFISNWNVLK
jgi:hypothetical protein